MKKNETILIVLLTILLPFSLQAQESNYKYETVHGSAYANGGNYGYEADIAYSFGRLGGEPYLKIGIKNYRITSFHIQGYETPDEFDFPITINHHQANIEGSYTVHYTYGRTSIHKDFKILGVRQGDFLDRIYFEEDDIPGAIDTWETKDDWTASFYIDINNSYIEVLSDIASRIKQEAKRTEKEEEEAGYYGDINSLNGYLDPGKSSEHYKSGLKHASSMINSATSSAEENSIRRKAATIQENYKKAFEHEIVLKEIEVQSRRDQEKWEEEQKQIAENNKYKSTEQLQQEESTRQMYNSMLALSRIDIPEADLETGSWGVSYAFNDFKDLGIFYDFIATWNHFLIRFDFKASMKSFDSWEPNTDTEDYAELLSPGILEEGDILFSDYKSTYSTVTHRSYSKSEIRSFGGGLGVGLGFRFNITRSQALRFLVEGELYSGTNMTGAYGYNAIAQYEIGRMIFGVGYNNTYFNFQPVYGSEVDRIIVVDNFESNYDWVRHSSKTIDGTTVSYHLTDHEQIENAIGFNLLKQTYIQVSLAFKIR